MKQPVKRVGRPKRDTLTPRLKLLVDTFLTDGKQQYLTTGRFLGWKGSEPQICENVKKAINEPAAQKYMDSLATAATKKTLLTVEWIIEQHLVNVRWGLAQTNASGRTVAHNALVQLQKRTGGFVERQEVTGADGLPLIPPVIEVVFVKPCAS